ncbi:hypothetical protein AWRIB129_1568 [Oenococcus oeni DSM 20252 = AWRIB129]|nr:hypothetical protein AWRIB553_1307 [Oenococcus oeni AWRIB553]EKP87981.1 hypothetical protein AWRIB129_1568 [Oenococcus oeni DSM 20252 = AWRIB129]
MDSLLIVENKNLFNNEISKSTSKKLFLGLFFCILAIILIIAYIFISRDNIYTTF